MISFGIIGHGVNFYKWNPIENLGHFKSEKDSSAIDKHRQSSPQHQLLIKMESPIFTSGQETMGVGHLFYIFSVENHLKGTVK